MINLKLFKNNSGIDLTEKQMDDLIQTIEDSVVECGYARNSTWNVTIKCIVDNKIRWDALRVYN